MTEFGNHCSLTQSEVIPQQNFDLIRPKSDPQIHLSFVTLSEILMSQPQFPYLLSGRGAVIIASIHESNREFNQVMAVKQSLSFLSYKLGDLQ